METERKVRFLYPPLVLVGALIVGFFVDRGFRIDALVPKDLSLNVPAMLGILAGGGVLIVVAGYVIGTLSHVVVRILSLLPCVPYVYAAPIAPDAIKRMRKKLEVDDGVVSDNLYPLAAFDHCLLHHRMRDWLDRRWQAMHTSINCCTGLIVAIVIAWFVPFQCSYWWICTFVAAAMFLTHGCVTWREVRGMLEFQSHGPFPSSTAESANHEA